MSHEGNPGSGIEKEKSAIGINFAFGEKGEIWRVKNTIERLPWHRENGYGDRNSRLPEGITEHSSPEEIQAAVAAEFKEDFYKGFAEQIEEQWPALAERLELLKEIPSFKFFDSYTIQLTQYGSGGSYNSEKGLITTNIRNYKPVERIMETISHEIIHIGIQKLIEKYNVQHSRKERLVDLIGAHYSMRNHMQKDREDARVDAAFTNLFPDVEAIARAIGEPAAT